MVNGCCARNGYTCACFPLPHARTTMDASLTRFLFDALDVRGAFVRLGTVWQHLHARRTWPPPVAHLAGELSAVAALIAGNLKQPGRITLQIQGHGIVPLAVADCTENLALRAMARCAEALPPALPATARALVGDGQLQLTLDTPALGEPWTSLVALEGETLAEIFAHYLEHSEQQPTRLFLAADANNAAALFLQALPPKAPVQDADGWQRVSTLAATVRREELLTLEAPALLARLFAEEDVRVFAPRPIAVAPPPSREKLARVVRSLGEAQARAIVAEHGELRIDDELSNHSEIFRAEDLDALFATSGQPS